MLGSAAGSVTRTSPAGSSDAGRPRDVVEHPIAPTYAVQRVDEDRPDRGVRDEEADLRVRVRRRVRPGDERDRGDRAQELDHDRRCSRASGSSRWGRPPRPRQTIAIASPWAIAFRVAPISLDERPGRELAPERTECLARTRDGVLEVEPPRRRAPQRARRARRRASPGHSLDRRRSAPAPRQMTAFVAGHLTFGRLLSRAASPLETDAAARFERAELTSSSSAAIVPEL